jgi:hypothetical protein
MIEHLQKTYPQLASSRTTWLDGSAMARSAVAAYTHALMRSDNAPVLQTQVPQAYPGVQAKRAPHLHHLLLEDLQCANTMLDGLGAPESHTESQHIWQTSAHRGI